GVERQNAAMTLDQAPHHLGLARGAERGACFLALLRRDEPVDDFAALHQQPMHRLVDAVDLPAQLGKRGRVGARRLGHLLLIRLRSGASLIGSRSDESKENIDRGRRHSLRSGPRPSWTAMVRPPGLPESWAT